MCCKPETWSHRAKRKLNAVSRRSSRHAWVHSSQGAFDVLLWKCFPGPQPTTKLMVYHMPFSLANCTDNGVSLWPFTGHVWTPYYIVIMSLQLSGQNWLGSLENRNNYSSLTCTHLEKDALVRLIMSFLDVLCRQHLKWCRINYVEGKGNFTSELILLTSGNDSFSCLFNSFFENVIIVWEIWLQLGTCQVLTHIWVQDVPALVHVFVSICRTYGICYFLRAQKESGKDPQHNQRGRFWGFLPSYLLLLATFHSRCILTKFLCVAQKCCHGLTGTTKSYGKSLVFTFDKMLIN